MVENVKRLLNESFETIMASELSILVLKVYSALYLNGASLGFCGNCLQNYLNEIKKTGMEKAEIYDQVKVRTLILKNKTGIMYIPALCDHISLELLTDEKAIDLLNKKIISENLFEKLPDGYNNTEIIPIVEETIIPNPKKNNKK